jgi:hypothetical protein
MKYALPLERPSRYALPLERLSNYALPLERLSNYTLPLERLQLKTALDTALETALKTALKSTLKTALKTALRLRQRLQCAMCAKAYAEWLSLLSFVRVSTVARFSAASLGMLLQRSIFLSPSVSDGAACYL